MKKRVGRLVGMFWRQALGYGIIIAIVVGVLWFQIGTLQGAFSEPELAARGAADSIHKIIDNPLFLPHKAVQYIFMLLGQDGVFWMRSASALFGILILIIFFDIIRSWYSQRVALIGSFLLLSSAWFLHYARIGTPEILFACSIGLLWAGIKLRAHTAPRIRTILASIAIFLACLYIPGLAWLIVPLLIWQRKLVRREFSKIPKILAVFVALGSVIIILPLGYAFLREPVLILDWLMIPRQIEFATWFSNLWHIPLWVSLRGPYMPIYWLGRTPLLDILSLTMFIFGVYVLAHYRRLDRVRAILTVILLGGILAIFNGPVALVIALPLIYIVVTAGLALLLQQWFTVFPRNPLARSVGLAMVCVIVALAGYYNLQSYFVAWPRSPETKQAFPQVRD